MQIELKLNPFEIREAIVEYLNRKGYGSTESNVVFVISQGHDYYDRPTGPELTCATIQVTTDEKV